MSKREAQLKAAFTRELTRTLPHYFVLLYATLGAPDREIIGDGRSTRWEFKHGTPNFASIGAQELFCARLAMADHCRYVIWRESAKGDNPCTLIVHPKHVLDRSLKPEAWTAGFDHVWLVEQIRLSHAHL